MHFKGTYTHKINVTTGAAEQVRQTRQVPGQNFKTTTHNQYLCLRNVYARCQLTGEAVISFLSNVSRQFQSDFMQQLCQNNRLHVRNIYVAILVTHANDCSPSPFHIVQLSVLLTVQLFASQLVIVFQYLQLRVQCMVIAIHICSQLCTYSYCVSQLTGYVVS